MGLEAILAEEAAAVKTLGWHFLTKLMSLECGIRKSWRSRQDGQFSIVKAMLRTLTVLAEQQVSEQGQLC